jgi:hypothetical protein
MFGYEVRVRGTTYLWGSKGISANLHWPLLLAIRNDVVGEPIKIQSETDKGVKTLIGTLDAGECHTVSLLGLRGVLATCDPDSTVTCMILVPHIGPPP